MTNCSATVKVPINFDSREAGMKLYLEIYPPGITNWLLLKTRRDLSVTT